VIIQRNGKCLRCDDGFGSNCHHETYASLYEEAPRDLTFLCRCHHALYHLWRDYRVTDWDVINAVHANTPLTSETSKYISLAMDAKHHEFGDTNPVPAILSKVSRELMINAPLYIGVAKHTHIWLTIIGSSSEHASQFAMSQMYAALNPHRTSTAFMEIGKDGVSAVCVRGNSPHRPGSFMYSIDMDDVKNSNWTIDNPVYNDEVVDVLVTHIKFDMNMHGCLFILEKQIEQAICDCINRYHINS